LLTLIMRITTINYYYYYYYYDDDDDDDDDDYDVYSVVVERSMI